MKGVVQYMNIQGNTVRKMLANTDDVDLTAEYKYSLKVLIKTLQNAATQKMRDWK